MPVLVFVPPSFCLTTYKNVILGGEYVSLRKLKASYSNSLALDGFKYLKRHSIPTFWLVLIYSSLILYASFNQGRRRCGLLVV